jgi:hypothetical protein
MGKIRNKNNNIYSSFPQVTVGTISGRRCALFDKPMTPAEIHDAIYTEVQPFNITSAVLQGSIL